MTKALTNQRPVPLAPILGLGAILAATILGVGVTRYVSGPVPPPAEPVAIASRNLLFQDRPDGGIVVSDADNGRRVAVIAPQTGEFVRITLRGLAHIRKRWDVPQSAPFRLSAGAEGRLTLKDPATGNLIELEAFGRTNAGDFAELLAAPETGPQTAPEAGQGAGQGARS